MRNWKLKGLRCRKLSHSEALLRFCASIMCQYIVLVDMEKKELSFFSLLYVETDFYQLSEVYCTCFPRRFLKQKEFSLIHVQSYHKT